MIANMGHIKDLNDDSGRRNVNTLKKKGRHA